MDRKAIEYGNEWLAEQLANSERKKIIEDTARDTAEAVAKDYINSEKRNIKVELDRRSVEKTMREMLRQFNSR